VTSYKELRERASRPEQAIWLYSFIQAKQQEPIESTKSALPFWLVLARFVPCSCTVRAHRASRTARLVIDSRFFPRAGGGGDHPHEFENASSSRTFARRTIIAGRYFKLEIAGPFSRTAISLKLRTASSMLAMTSAQRSTPTKWRQSRDKRRHRRDLYRNPEGRTREEKWRIRRVCFAGAEATAHAGSSGSCGARFLSDRRGAVAATNVDS
jgi:hypothetical protein